MANRISNILNIRPIMKSKCMLLVLFLLGPMLILAQDGALSESAEVLFKDAASSLSTSEMNQLAEATGFALASNGSQFYFKDDSYSKEFPFNVEVIPVDINKDGLDEIALVFGNSAVSGPAGSSGALYIKNEAGQYQSNFGFPGMYAFLSTNNLGYPDVLIGGPGFEFPVWRWDGTAYAMNRKISDAELEALNPVFFGQANETYPSARQE